MARLMWGLFYSSLSLFDLHSCETAQHAPQGMVRCTVGVGADCSWSSSQDRAVAISSRSQSEPRPRCTAASDFEWWGKEGVNATAAAASSHYPREEDARAGPFRCIHQSVSFAGRVEFSRGRGRGRETCIGVGVGQGTETVRRIASGTSDRDHEIARAKKRILVADEKIRLAQVALRDARDDKEYDVREVPLAEARLERFLKEVVPVRQTPLVSTVSDLEAEVHRLRTQLAQMQVASVGRHPPQSSTQAAELLRERAAKRRAGVSEPIPTDPQDLDFWMTDKHMELRDAIEFGDQESILSLTDLTKGRRRFRRSFPWSPMWCPREEHQSQVWLSRVPRRRSIEPGTSSNTQCQAFAEHTIGLREWFFFQRGWQHVPERTNTTIHQQRQVSCVVERRRGWGGFPCVMSPLWPHPETSHTNRKSERTRTSAFPLPIWGGSRCSRRTCHVLAERSWLWTWLSEALSRGMERLSPGPQKRMAPSCCKLGSTRKTSTQNSSTGDVGSWLWLWKREADGAVRLWTSSGSSPRPKPGKSHPSFLTKQHWCGNADGQGCWARCALCRLRGPWWNLRNLLLSVQLMGTRHLGQRFWPMIPGSFWRDWISSPLKKLMSTQYTASWCIFHALCRCCARRSTLKSITSRFLWFLSIGSTNRKNTVCFLLKIWPPGSNPELMIECKLNAHPTWKMYWKKLLWIFTLSCNERSIRLRLGNTIFFSWSISTIFFLLSSMSLKILFNSTEMNCSISFRCTCCEWRRRNVAFLDTS